MLLRRAPLILPLLALPALIACGSGSGDAAPAPLSPAVLATVVEKPGVSRERLAREIDALFTDKAAGETRALVVMRNGRIVGERYAAGFTPETRHIGWSMSKTVTGVMIGQLVSDGRLRLDESAPVPAWQRSGDPRGEITLRQLLQMRSGLRHTEMGDPLPRSDEVRMLFRDGRDDMAAYAEAQPLEAEPGRSFEYSSATTVILADIAARALTESHNPAVRRQIVNEYLRTRLFEPAGMKSMTAEFDAAGTFIGSSMVYATARDWGRFGEFLRQRGAVSGAQLVPVGWIDLMTRPSPRNAAYGAQLWLNRRRPDGTSPLFPDRAPANVFACVGFLGQYVIVFPDQRLTIVRLGKTEEQNDRRRVVNHLADIAALFSRS